MIIENVEELETKFDFPRIKGKSFKISPQEFPPGLLFLMPFIEYYIVDDELGRESFIKTAPLKALEFLEETMAGVDNLVTDYLGNYKKRKQSPVYWALTLLREMAEGYSGFRDDVEITITKTEQELEDFFNETENW